MSAPIPRPIESTTTHPTQPSGIEWVSWDLSGEKVSELGMKRARVSRFVRRSRHRTEAHHPDLSELQHEFDDSLHCCGCGREYLAVCAFRPRCEGAG